MIESLQTFALLAHLERNLFLLGYNVELQSDAAMLILSGVRVEGKCLLLSRVGDGPKRIKKTTHEIVTFHDCLLSNVSTQKERLNRK